MSILAVSKHIQPIIVDVREPAEYHDLHLYGAINIPSSRFAESDYKPYRARQIYLVCNTGRRASIVKELRP